MVAKVQGGCSATSASDTSRKAFSKLMGTGSSRAVSLSGTNLLELWVLCNAHLLRQHGPACIAKDREAFVTVAHRLDGFVSRQPLDTGPCQHLREREGRGRWLLPEVASQDQGDPAKRDLWKSPKAS